MKGFLGHAISLAHEVVDERVGQHVVARLANDLRVKQRTDVRLVGK